jgi:hypothetical protein
MSENQNVDEPVYQPQHVKEETPGFMPDKVYDVLRFMAVIVLPALGAAYFGLASIWGLPAAEQVVGTIVVVDTFAGVLLRSARKSYEASDARFDGVISVKSDSEDGLTQLSNLQLDPQAVANKDEIVVKIQEH